MPFAFCLPNFLCLLPTLLPFAYISACGLLLLTGLYSFFNQQLDWACLPSLCLAAFRPLPLAFCLLSPAFRHAVLLDAFFFALTSFHFYSSVSNTSDQLSLTSFAFNTIQKKGWIGSLQNSVKMGRGQKRGYPTSVKVGRGRIRGRLLLAFQVA